MMDGRIDNKKLFDEITGHLLKDDSPSDYINRLSKEAFFKEYPYELLMKMKTTEQSKQYHAEGSVWNHTMLVLDEAAKVRDQVSDPAAFLWAAFLHDIGKPVTTRYNKGRITSYNHDEAGAKLSIEFLQNITDDNEFIRKVSTLVKYHMHILYVLKDLPYGNVKELLKETDINDIALLARCDRFGRSGADRELEEDNYRQFLNKLMVD